MEGSLETLLKGLIRDIPWSPHWRPHKGLTGAPKASLETLIGCLTGDHPRRLYVSTRRW